MAINVFDILFLPVLFFVGLITGYEDARYGKVRNKWIKIGLFWGLAAIVFFYCWSLVAAPATRFFYFDILGRPVDSVAPVFTVSLVYLNKVVINAAASLLVAYLMWKACAWAAGDAKLFFVYALLLPLKYYWKSYLPIFPSFVLLINIFIPIFAYLLIRSLFHNAYYFYKKIKARNGQETKKSAGAKPARKRGMKKNWPGIKGKFVTTMIFVSLFLTLNFFQGMIKNMVSIDMASFQAFFFAGLIVFRSSMGKIFKKPATFWIAAAALVSILSYGSAISPSTTWLMFYRSVLMMVAFMLLWGAFKKMIDFHTLKTATGEIAVENLKAKMNLEDQTIDEIKKDKEFFAANIGCFYPEGLTDSQAEAVRKWLLEKKKTKIKIYHPFPFVLWMLAGVIITLVLKSSLFHLFIKAGS